MNPSFPHANLNSMDRENHLKNFILSKIREKGRIAFDEFMHLALYTLKLGYYSGHAVKFGKEGDFITAPEISPLFSHCLARNFLNIASQIKNADICEFGAGTGKMATDILLALEKYQQLPENYFIIETSETLKQRQREMLHRRCSHLSDRVVWLDANSINSAFSIHSDDNHHNSHYPMLSEFAGLIIANEVLDAMPVRRFSLFNDQIYEYFVNEKDEDLIIEKVPLSKEQSISDNSASLQYVKDNIHALHLDFTNSYEFEINFNISSWIQNISSCLKQGVALIIDYGFPRHELYHPDRSIGTLMCHHRHKMLVDPLLNIGNQDITAHIDFTLIAESAVDSGLEVLGFTSQAAFLLNSGLLEILETSSTLASQASKSSHPLQSTSMHNTVQELQQNHAIQLLTSPAEMGELFKVIALGKDCDFITLPGFSSHDHRHRL